MSKYSFPTYRLKERIYENSDKSIVIFRTRKKQTIKYIAVKVYSKARHPFFDKEYFFLKNYLFLFYKIQNLFYDN